MGASKSDLLQLRMKLIDGKVVSQGVDRVTASEKKLGKTTDEVSRKQKYATHTQSRLTSSYKSLGTAARYGLGFLGVGGVLAIKSSIQATEDLALATSGLTRNFGFSTNVASRWAAVIHGRSVEPKALTMAFASLSTKMTEAGRKGGTLLTPFHQLGLTQADAAKGAKDFEWGLLRVAKALGEEEGSARRSTAAKALLGKGFQTLTPLFSEGVEGLKEQLEWADKYGVTLNTTTKDGLMEMVMAQRENKVAMLGLQVSVTKALMPAIHAGDDELQKFIATLNSPHLTAEEKMNRISDQFLALEKDLVRIIEQALPEIAEQGGHLGVALAGAVWHGFINSDTLGKLVIGAWLFKSFGGLSLVGALGAKVGGRLATTLGWAFLETVAPYFAAEVGTVGLGAALASQMAGLKTLFRAAGATLGTAMGLAAAGALVAEIVFAVENSEDIAGLSLFDTPKLDATGIEEKSLELREKGYTDIGFINGREFQATTPSGKKVIVEQKGKRWVQHPAGKSHEGGRQRSGNTRPRTAGTSSIRRSDLEHAPKQRRRGGGGGKTIEMHNHLHLDGKEISESVTTHALDEAALG